ncbi:Uncharacterised protein [Vibrio cholerae]|nr:Uncharacterised protein [Vibrio cholerae]CSC89925.1 Uncharacterised protein [Vibrio cholerae]
MDSPFFIKKRRALFSGRIGVKSRASAGTRPNPSNQSTE